MATSIKYFSIGHGPDLNAPAPSESDDLTVAYRTVGLPSNPAVLIPTCFSGKMSTTLSFLYGGEDSILKDHFVVICGLLGGGESSSPSNAPPSLCGDKFPTTSYEDNIHLQHSLCKALGIKQLAAYIGFSMAGQQGYYMATMFPGFVKHLVVLASASRTSWHNKSFLEGPKAALESSIDWHGGRYAEPAVIGTRAFARVYSTWALSSAWFRQEQWKRVGCADVEEYLTRFWDGGMGALDANDLMCMMQCWRRGDIAEHAGGDWAAALASIDAKVLLMPSRTDLYFPPEDSFEEVKHLKKGEVRVIESVWGHLAGGEWGPPEDKEFIREEIRKFISAEA
ncbi:Alpha/Beta hydrolase protein [Plectosphaerella cucumerina]|jgi:homoserine O-acetyltransferase|uniref:Alpha/Beta hydrolase protein n=1 Tax=Plectosphaerella cucumerina TaxID=40658 RepID=A0A8K0WZP2_9PEZI|nr:Alpha/Beta hydrolase protein [Plectosphaerella cucumerina]